MKTKIIRLGILVIMLVFGAAVNGCNNDSKIEGTWLYENVTLKKGSRSELIKMVSSFIDQLPGVSAEEREDAKDSVSKMSDSEIKQLLESALEESRKRSENSELKLDNGNFEVSINGVLNSKGTYVISNGKMTQTTTHINGELFDLMGSQTGFESKMYTLDELNKALEDIDPMFAGYFNNPMFSEQTQSYSVSGNKLTLTDDFCKATYTRK